MSYPAGPWVPDPEAIPEELRVANRWVRWKAVRDGKGKPRKVPIDVASKVEAKSNDETTWGTFTVAHANATKAPAVGVGFMLGRNGTRGYAGVDLDGVRDPETGELAPEAEVIVRRCATYCEVSPSGTGVKLFGYVPIENAPVLPRNKADLDDGGEVEVYAKGRYFTVTGDRVEGSPVALGDLSEALAWLTGRYLSRPGAEAPGAAPDEAPAHDDVDAPEENVRRATAYLRTIPGAVSGEGGHDATWRAAEALVRGFRLSERQALALLLANFNPTCTPPWSERDLRHKVHDARTKGTLPLGYLVDKREETPATEAGPDPRRLITPGDLFEEFLLRKSTAIPTAFPRLNRALGGGVETRRNTVVTAQAGAGKTAFLVQNVAYAAMHGNYFGILALRDGDQWADGVRLAQLAGVDRFRLRDGDPAEVERAREAMATYRERLMFYDVTAKGACIADMIDRGRTWAAGRGPLLVGTDSIHVMPYSDVAKESAMNLYERVGFRLEALHCDLVKYDVAALTTAQSSREAYRRKRTEENVEELAAISGGHVAENTIDVLLTFGKTTEAGLSWLLIPKSRIGGQGERIPLRYDADRSRWIETDDTQDTEAEKPAQTRAKARAEAKDEAERKRQEGVAQWLRKHPEGGTASEIAQATGRCRNWVADVLAGFHAKGWVASGSVMRLNARGREVPISVWTWKTADA